MGTIQITTVVFTMVLLYLGGMVAGFIIPLMPIALSSGWIEGIFTGIIQVLILAGLGLFSGKLSLWNILLGAILILIGGMIGGMVASWLGLSGLFATVCILAIQTLCLIFMGFIKGSQKPKLPA